MPQGRMTGRIARIALAALAVPGVLAAQAPSASWSARTEDNGSLIIGSAFLYDHALSLFCTAPSPRGLPLMQTGSHESHQSGPFGMFIGFSDFLFDWDGPFVQRGALLIVGDQPFELPEFELDELRGTAVTLPMSAPVVQALYTASSLALLTPRGEDIHRFSVQGLVPALETALAACTDRWVALGHAPPLDLARQSGAAQDLAVAQPPVGGSKTEFAPVRVADLPAVIPAHVRAICGGSARIDEAAVRIVDDFDLDNLPDFVLHYGDIDCQNGIPRGFCGAANCLIEVFLSSLGHAAGFEFLAIEVEPAHGAYGQLGLRMHATPSICADGACEWAWIWNGTTFSID